MEELLNIEDLSIYYITEAGETKAVNNLNLKLGKGETLGFVGETGAGKTTTALGIMRLVPNPPGKIVSGKISFDGEDILSKTEKEMQEIRGNKISMIFQDPMTSLNPVMTVGEQIGEVLALHQNLKKEELKEKTAQMLETVGIKRERINDYPHQFSGGMKQRVVIAMALACNPMLIIADEPTTALDVTIQAQVLELMIELQNKYNTSMIMITHDLGIVAEICDHVAIMYAGSVIEYGTVEKLYTDPKHPYTKGLFASIPTLDADEESLHVIKGTPPNPVDLPTGCKFHPRCEFATERCKCEVPKMIDLDDSHCVSCFLFDKGGEK
ncbi:ABC transporter ATP-binding protein [Treponema denticola]|uniref:Oligopeptide/dipeptide ABC transporter, ATP-binding protein n=1 Tax=Treponema denticola SP33 TaxID=999437 RepID=M2BKD3_TREDN|nr:ABC transporter ATP-binding protein [Treponema denticola]EMB21958.1 oligopeptide/dipeptide ABC transporter, ATP-binding protein [Treponema denticola SP33]EPF35921.1 oligopeptide/dipeptide ABC transporter, ATP-binding protein domain [Treponema denticola SP32]UTD12502.1 ABC transporter ATP-binding protein [Treponema denticola]